MKLFSAAFHHGTVNTYLSDVGVRRPLCRYLASIVLRGFFLVDGALLVAIGGCFLVSLVTVHLGRPYGEAV